MLVLSCNTSGSKDNLNNVSKQAACDNLDCLFEGGVVFEDQTQEVSQDDWSISLPSDAWEVRKTDEDVKFVAGNKEKHNLVVLVKEEFPGSFQQYVVLNLKSLKDNGSILISAKPAVIDNKKFVLIESLKANARVWMWVTVRNNFGYGLACGGIEENGERYQHDVCFTISKSLKLK